MYSQTPSMDTLSMTYHVMLTILANIAGTQGKGGRGRGAGKGGSTKANPSSSISVSPNLFSQKA